MTFVTAGPPSVVSLPAMAVTASTASLNASVNANGLATSYYFQYGTSTSYGSSTATYLMAATNIFLSVNNAVGGLTPGTQFHFQIVAANSDGTTTGGDETFITPAHSVLAANSQAVGWLTSAPLTKAMVSDAPSVTVSSAVENPATDTVFYRINGGGYTANNGPFALNSGANPLNVKVVSSFGATNIYTVNILRALSSDSSLVGLSVSPGSIVPAFAPGTLNYSSAVLNVVPGVTVSATTTFSNATLQIAGGAMVTNTGSASVTPGLGTNLIPVVVTAEDGVTTTTYTLAIVRTVGPPIVTVLPASQITKTAAVLNADVNPQGTNASVYFQYGVTTNYGTTTTGDAIASAVVAEPVSLTANNLSAGTTYHYRAVASSFFGTVMICDMEFVTIGVPVNLSIAQSPTGPAQALISWPTNAVGAVLESTGVLPASNWQAVTNSVSVVSGSNMVIINASTNAQFFRLNYP